MWLADNSLHKSGTLSVFEKYESRNDIRTIASRKFRILIDIYQEEMCFMSVFFFKAFYHRFHHGTFTTPGSIEHHHDRKERLISVSIVSDVRCSIWKPLFLGFRYLASGVQDSDDFIHRSVELATAFGQSLITIGVFTDFLFDTFPFMPHIYAFQIEILS